MDRPPFPPTRAAADEEIVTDSAAFAHCEAALHAFGARGGGLVTERQYAVSPEWGNVLRAKVDMAGGAISVPVIVWRKPGEGVQLYVDMGRER